jgi:hypothetical protein
MKSKNEMFEITKRESLGIILKKNYSGKIGGGSNSLIFENLQEVRELGRFLTNFFNRIHFSRMIKKALGEEVVKKHKRKKNYVPFKDATANIENKDELEVV